MQALVSTEEPRRAAFGYAAFAAIFFASGFSALIYQITWQRSLFSIYGINIEAATVVISGFLLGLGFGSLLGGRLSRVKGIHLLVVFGLVEMMTGAFGIVSLRIFRFVGGYTLGLAEPLPALVTIGLVVAPTLLMGATLPILANYLVRLAGNVGRSVGLLYCVNTLGSAVGCFASAAVIMRDLGMQGSVTLAGLINLGVASSALYLAYRRRGEDRGAEPRAETNVRAPATREPTATPPLTLGFVLILSGLTGYVALSFEILWFRAFVIATNLAPAFALILGAYLAGIALGSYWVRRFCDAGVRDQRIFYILCSVIFVSAVLGYLILPISAATATGPLGVVFPMLGLVFAQTAIAGAAFPIMCHACISPDEWAGSRMSRVYAANIIGSVAGTLLTGFVLMDVMRLAQINSLLGALGAGGAALVAVIAPITQTRRLAIIGVSAVAVVASPLAAPSLFHRFYEKIVQKADIGRSAPYTRIVENKSGVITVDADGVTFGEGMYDGEISVSLVHEVNWGLERPYALSLLHPAPHRVLEIGLSTGAWAQILVSDPAVEHLTVVEINPGYLSLIQRYPIVASLLHNPKVEIIIDDGRRWLNRHPDEKFDAIIQNNSWNFRPNVTNLLSREYMRLMAAHLRDGGILMYNATGSRRAERTGCQVLSYCVRLLDAIFAGNQPLRFDPARLRRVLAAYRIDRRPVFDMSDPQQVKRFNEVMDELSTIGSGAGVPIESRASILARTGKERPITDDNMGTEWRLRGPDGGHTDDLGVSSVARLFGIHQFPQASESQQN